MTARQMFCKQSPIVDENDKQITKYHNILLTLTDRLIELGNDKSTFLRVNERLRHSNRLFEVEARYLKYVPEHDAINEAIIPFQKDLIKFFKSEIHSVCHSFDYEVYKDGVLYKSDW